MNPHSSSVECALARVDASLKEGRGLHPSSVSCVVTCQEGNVERAETHSSIQVSGQHQVFVVWIVGEKWRESLPVYSSPVTPEGA